MVPLARGQDVPLASLRLAEQIGDGGQGTVHALADHPHLVFKRYRAGRVDGTALAALVELPLRLPERTVALLDAGTAWPYARVMAGEEACGFVMPLAPPQFFGLTRAGRRPRALQYLLFPWKPLWGEITPLRLPGRWSVIRRFARLLATLHQHQVVLGDISMNNLLWSPPEPASIFLIDCDGARVGAGGAPLPQPDTPDWDDPATASTAADADSDAYKLALLVGRVLSGNAYLRPGEHLPLPRALAPEVATTLAELHHRAAGPKGTRPTARDWDSLLSTGRLAIPMPHPSAR